MQAALSRNRNPTAAGFDLGTSRWLSTRLARPMWFVADYPRPRDFVAAPWAYIRSPQLGLWRNRLGIYLAVVLFWFFLPVVVSAWAQSELQSPRQALRLLGVHEGQLTAMRDGASLNTPELETLYRVLLNLPRFDKADIHRWRQYPVDWDAILARPSQHRGDLVRVAGAIELLQSEPLNPEAVGRFDFDRIYRVDLSDENSGQSYTVYARNIPEAWQRSLADGQPINEFAAADAMFLKTVPNGAQSQNLILATDRIEWFPRQPNARLGVQLDQVLLADLGMDIGLLDEVMHGSLIGHGDRECFYGLLAAVGRTGPRQLSRSARTEYDLAQFLQKPATQRGRLFSLSGTARRAIRVEVSDADIRSRFGIDHYHEIEMFLPLNTTLVLVDPTDGARKEYHTFPVTFCVRQLPAGFPEGIDIRQQVRIDGFYMKLWSYRSQFMSMPTDGDDEGARKRKQRSPLLIGIEPVLLSSQATSNRSGAIVGVAAVVALILIWFGLTIYRRGDEAFKQRTRATQPDRLPDDLLS